MTIFVFSNNEMWTSKVWSYIPLKLHAQDWKNAKIVLVVSSNPEDIKHEQYKLLSRKMGGAHNNLEIILKQNWRLFLPPYEQEQREYEQEQNYQKQDDQKEDKHEISLESNKSMPDIKEQKEDKGFIGRFLEASVLSNDAQRYSMFRELEKDTLKQMQNLNNCNYASYATALEQRLQLLSSSLTHIPQKNQSEIKFSLIRITSDMIRPLGLDELQQLGPFQKFVSTSFHNESFYHGTDGFLELFWKYPYEDTIKMALHSLEQGNLAQWKEQSWLFTHNFPCAFHLLKSKRNAGRFGQRILEFRFAPFTQPKILDFTTIRGNVFKETVLSWFKEPPHKLIVDLLSKLQYFLPVFSAFLLCQRYDWFVDSFQFSKKSSPMENVLVNLKIAKHSHIKQVQAGWFVRQVLLEMQIDGFINITNSLCIFHPEHFLKLVQPQKISENEFCTIAYITLKYFAVKQKIPNREFDAWVLTLPHPTLKKATLSKGIIHSVMIHMTNAFLLTYFYTPHIPDTIYKWISTLNNPLVVIP